ncbi:MAG: WHG domain-containing protein [Acidimicrobiia bacterium]|nr:WHG domain-containing protein [Acidimicrobiia bacterium]
MGRKLGLTREQVVEAAAEIADRDGLDAVSLASLASALGVRSPSLYNHVDGLAGLRRQLTFHTCSLLTVELADSIDGLEGIDALRAIAHQLRLFAHRHPGLYNSLLPAPAPDEDPDLAAALREPVTVVASVLDGLDIDATTVIPLIRALRAAVHGFVDLELRGGFGLPDDIDDSFSTTINLVIDAIAVHSRTRVSS